jgi:6-phosphogluconolactonase
LNLKILPTSEELSRTAAELVARLSAAAIAAQGRFTVALSGGSLPKLLGPALAAEPLRSQIDWSAWHIFWADERCVPLDHPDSNYLLARQYLFDHLPIPAAQIYPPDTSLNPVQSAAAYESALAQHFKPFSPTPNLQSPLAYPRTPHPGGRWQAISNLQFPTFDLILLGMGEDGHTASLFPGHPLLDETTRWVAPIFDSPKPPPQRVTLTLPVLNQANSVIFLVTGAGKAESLRRILQIKDDYLPAQRVQPFKGQLHWLVDAAAAADLPKNLS